MLNVLTVLQLAWMRWSTIRYYRRKCRKYIPTPVAKSVSVQSSTVGFWDEHPEFIIELHLRVMVRFLPRVSSLIQQEQTRCRFVQSSMIFMCPMEKENPVLDLYRTATSGFLLLPIRSIR